MSRTGFIRIGNKDKEYLDELIKVMENKYGVHVTAAMAFKELIRNYNNNGDLAPLIKAEVV